MAATTPTCHPSAATTAARLSAPWKLKSKSTSPAEKVSCEGNQPGEFIAWVHVFLDDVKRKIVSPAKTPHRHRQQHGGLQRRAVEDKQDDGGNPDEQEQQSLQFYPKRIRQVFHKFLIPTERGSV